MGRKAGNRDELPGERATPAERLEVIFEVRRATGIEARDLRLEQARVLQEVIEWMAQKRSAHGRDRAV